MKKIIVMGGSNSSASINRTLAQYTAKHVDGAETTTIDLSKTVLPLYSPDLEKASGIPDAVKDIDALIASADGIILSLAEYNGSYAAAFKNAFDWLSRINMKVWKEKPMLLMSTSPGKGGAGHVLATAKSGFPFFGANVVADFSLPSFNDNFVDGEIKDAEFKKALLEKVKIFQQAI